MVNPETHRAELATRGDESAYQAPASPAPQRTQVEVDDAKITANYANFCRLSGMPEELLMEFGLHSQPAGTTTQPIVVTQRIVTCWHTAKRFLAVLQQSVERHEAAFGVLETDVQKRIRRA